uniref:Uncharacterized protein n=1 Tax=Rubinisphaera brasiliensis (strain ATCC 49424 / DSM 5305 / JCM 21570 / IAM 15109 / NBRC 103401 / IFAM 1448) TaxID=756272 RepID=F0SPQ4_RUBBR|nr:hypothetical protein Plabr_1401 [Rubinisphaera brasiliensis DSM 5305]
MLPPGFPAERNATHICRPILLDAGETSREVLLGVGRKPQRHRGHRDLLSGMAQTLESGRRSRRKLVLWLRTTIRHRMQSRIGIGFHSVRRDAPILPPRDHSRGHDALIRLGARCARPPATPSTMGATAWLVQQCKPNSKSHCRTSLQWHTALLALNGWFVREENHRGTENTEEVRVRWKIIARRTSLFSEKISSETGTRVRSVAFSFSVSSGPLWFYFRPELATPQDFGL